MKIHLHVGLIISLSVIPVGFATASEDGHGKHATKSSQSSHQHATPHWAKTLGKKTKKMVDDMHHKLDTELKPLKAEEKRALSELNQLTIMGVADLVKINQKIDELMSIRNRILRHRHAHLVEMRAILTDEQRVSYDKAVLERSKVK